MKITAEDLNLFLQDERFGVTDEMSYLSNPWPLVDGKMYVTVDGLLNLTALSDAINAKLMHEMSK